MRDGARFCPNCGLPQDEAVVRGHGRVMPDGGSLGWSVLAFLIPLVGLVLWAAWRRVRPRSAWRAGVGTLAGMATRLALYLVLVLVGALLPVTLLLW